MPRLRNEVEPDGLGILLRQWQVLSPSSSLPDSHIPNPLISESHILARGSHEQGNNTALGRRPNGFHGLSLKDRTILFLVILLDKTD